MITTKQYCDNIRALGKKLASGELDEYRLDLTELSENMDGDDFYKITRNISYTRTTINRVPEVKAAGSISIKIEEDEIARYYVFSINREPKRKVITNDDLPRLEQSWRNRFIKHLLKTTPRITDLEGEKLEGAAIAIERFIALVEDYAKEEAE